MKFKIRGVYEKGYNFNRRLMYSLEKGGDHWKPPAGFTSHFIDTRRNSGILAAFAMKDANNRYLMDHSNDIQSR